MDEEQVIDMEQPADTKTACQLQRAVIDGIKADVKDLFDNPIMGDHADGCDIGEVKANIKIAYRHLEDARMRLGKAIQALDGGVSCYEA